MERRRELNLEGVRRQVVERAEEEWTERRRHGSWPCRMAGASMPRRCSLRRNLSAGVSAEARDSRRRCTLAVEAVRSTRRVGAIHSRGRPNERRLTVGCGGREARPGRREVLQVFVRRISSCAMDESWTGVRRTNKIGARSARPASGSRRTFSGWQEPLRADACIQRGPVVSVVACSEAT
jgi:hypothetical protein